MNNEAADGESQLSEPLPTPNGTRCPLINAAVIFAVANGDVTLNRQQPVATDSQPAAETLPLAEKPAEGYRPRQPNRLAFDAADIFRLSQAGHPWQAEPIEKAESTADPSASENRVPKAG